MNLVSQFLCIFLFSIPILSFEKSELYPAIKNWAEKNKNEVVILITSPNSGKIEFAYSEKKAFHKKLLAGSIIKTLSSFVFLANPKNFKVYSETKFICKGKFEEPELNFFTFEDKKRYNLIEDETSGKHHFRCSVEKGHGEVTLETALSLSCNAYYLQYASQTPIYFYNSLVRDWKLTEGTGASFELKDNYKISEKIQLSQFGMTLTSIGDSGEIKLTALKIAQIYGSIFAETPLLKPILKGETPEIFSPFPYSEKLRWTIKRALQITVREGTLKNIKLNNTSIQILAGKTGTPTQEGKKYQTHGWNIIYFKKGDTPYLLTTFTNKGSAKKETLELSTLILNLL